MSSTVILGASQGLGRFLATALSDRGWHVVGVGRRAVLDPNFQYLQEDLSDPDSLDRLSKLLADHKPELIVHNATSYGATPGEPMELADLETLFRVNALLPYQLLLGHLTGGQRADFCSCVVVNSDSIYHANATSGSYAASKAALRVLTTSLAHTSRAHNASVCTLLLGPLADQRKLTDLRSLAERRGVEESELVRSYLRRSNPAQALDTLIDYDSCLRSVEYLISLGGMANGMLCKLDGGSSGSLV